MQKKTATKSKPKQQKESGNTTTRNIVFKLNGEIELHNIIRDVCNRIRLEAEQSTLQAARLLQYRQELLKTHGVDDMKVVRSSWAFEHGEKEGGEFVKLE